MQTYDTLKPMFTRNNLVSVSASFIIPTSFLITFMAFSENLFHWFIIPILLCGILTFSDAMLWIRGKIDIFDPIGLVGLFGTYFFFLAPLLHVLSNHYISDVPQPDDWRDWLGWMGVINAIGLLTYRWSRGLIKDQPLKKKWVLNRKTAGVWLIFFIGITTILQFMFYRSQGGLSNFVLNFDQSEVSLSGNGFLFVFSESTPILLFVFITLLLKNNKTRKRTILFALCLLIILFLLKLYFGGLRGSRNNTIWYIFWVVCLCHNLIRPFSKKMIIMGLLFVTLFMYIYGFYKSGGISYVLDYMSGNDYEVEQRSGRSINSVLLGDYGRSDVQAIILKTVATTDYPLAYGKSYIGDIFKMLPPFIVDYNIPEKRYYGTMAQFYEGSIPYYGFLSTRLYGLVGEWLLNFGFLTTPIAFMLFGLFIGKIRIWYKNMDRDDARFYLLPFLLTLSILILVNDLDNHLYFLFRNTLVIGMILFINSKKIMNHLWKRRSHENEKA